MEKNFTTVMSSRIMLSDLVRGLMEYGHAKGVKSFPALYSSQWHEWLYGLKKKFPDELGELFFDCESFPRCQKLDDVMFGMHFICNERSGDFRTSLREGTLRLKDSEYFSSPANFEAIVATGFKLAKETEWFLEYP